jgi:IS1 family transposase
VADGHHGRTDRIQDFVCQACGCRVSARWGTALYQLKTPPARIGAVLSVLAEGLSVGAAVRVFGHGEATITRWRDRAAQQAARLHHHFFRDLPLPHVQLDEIRTRLRPRNCVLWLWLALDPQTKLIPALALGARTQQTAHTLVHGLRAVLAAGCTPVITTDGLRLYFYALTAHFGSWVTTGRRRCWQVDPALLYGQLHKRYRRYRLVRIRYQMGCGSRRALQAALRTLGWSGQLQTAFVERLNLTVRQSVAALTRRTWATAQTVSGLQHQVEWWRPTTISSGPIAACGTTVGPTPPRWRRGSPPTAGPSPRSSAILVPRPPNASAGAAGRAVVGPVSPPESLGSPCCDGKPALAADREAHGSPPRPSRSAAGIIPSV